MDEETRNEIITILSDELEATNGGSIDGIEDAADRIVTLIEASQKEDYISTVIDMTTRN